MHSSGTVVATCSGQRLFDDFDDKNSDSDSNESESDSDSSRADSESNSYPSPKQAASTSSGTDASSIRSLKPRKIPDNSIRVWSI